MNIKNNTEIPNKASAFHTKWIKVCSFISKVTSDIADTIWICPDLCITSIRNDLAPFFDVSLVSLEHTDFKTFFDKYYQKNKKIDIVFITKSKWKDGPQSNSYVAFLNLVQTFTYFNTINFKIITLRSIQCPLYEHVLHPLDAVYIGIGQTLCRELPRINTKIFSLRKYDQKHLNIALNFKENIINHHPICISQENIFVPHLEAVKLNEKIETTTFRYKGIYLIIGGCGGIGGALAKYLVSNYKAHLILLGRKEQKKHQLLLNELNGLGASKVQYIQLDIGKQKDKFIKLINDIPLLHGIIHSAISLRDKTILRMTQEELLEAIYPKVHGSYNICEAIKDKQMDWVLFFSSIQSYTSHEGQANYTAACVTKDAIANLLENVFLISSKIINWGFWGNIGVAANNKLRQQMAKLQIGSIEFEDGIAFIERFISCSEYNQLAFLKASDAALIERDITPEKKDFQIENSVIDKKDNTILIEQFIFNSNFDHSIYVEAANALDQYTRKSIQDIFSKNNIKVKLKYQPLIAAISEMKSEKNSLNRQELLTCYPLVKSCIQLLELCLNDYPKVISGDKSPISVLFPKGKIDLLQEYYAANYLNDSIANLIEKFTDKHKSIRILEVGAGTGSTTEVIISKLSKFIDEYTFNDVSEIFLNNARIKFSMYPFLNYMNFDITKRNTLTSGYYNIAIATNVIHAVSDIFIALTYIFNSLKSNGIFILNEAIDKHDFLTVTFGLLDGWWHSNQDGITRIKHTPLLSCDEWEKTLYKVGFKKVYIYGNEKQSLVIACK